MNVEIVEAQKKDLPAVLELYAVEDIDNGNTLPLAAAGALFDKIHTYPHYRIYAAKIDGKIVGTFSISIMDNLAHLGKPSGLVEDVVVASDMRSKGIGRRMMEHAMEICREHGCYKMSLSSNLIRKDAHRFYENLGFEKHGYSYLIRIGKK